MTNVCCGRCHAENPADFTFCFHCGARPGIDCGGGAKPKPAKTAAKKGRAKRKR